MITCCCFYLSRKAISALSAPCYVHRLSYVHSQCLTHQRSDHCPLVPAGLDPRLPFRQELVNRFQKVNNVGNVKQGREREAECVFLPRERVKACRAERRLERSARDVDAVEPWQVAESVSAISRLMGMSLTCCKTASDSSTRRGGRARGGRHPRPAAAGVARYYPPNCGRWHS